MPDHINKTYTVKCRRHVVCRKTSRFQDRGKKYVIRYLKSHGWTLDRQKGWLCPGCSET